MKSFNLFGEIVADDSQKWFDSDIVPAMIVGWLAKQDGDVEININSPGGDVTAGLAIANAIKGYSKGKVTANVLGIAASMASVVACACDEIKMGSGAFLMIHNPWGMTVGEAEDLRHQADVMDQMKDSIIGFYLTKSSKTAEELSEFMNAETWFTRDDAETYGFTVAPYAEEFKVAACLSHRCLHQVPEGAQRFFTVGEKPNAVATASAAPAEPENAVPTASEAENEPENAVPTASEAPAEPENAVPTAPVSDWEARYKGASKRINELTDANARLKEAADKAYLATVDYGTVCQERDAAVATIKDLKVQLDTVRGDLEKAKADLSSAVNRAETAEKDLARKGEQLDRLTKAHALLTGGVLTPGDGEAAEAEYRRALDAAGSAEQREAIRKAHCKATKK